LDCGGERRRFAVRAGSENVQSWLLDGPIPAFSPRNGSAIMRAMSMLAGKTGIVFGVANKRSIAWAIAQALSREGMRLAFTYQGERLKDGVEALAATLPDSVVLPCDVTRDEEIERVFQESASQLGRLDALVHAVAFAPREDLEGEFVNTSREGFKLAHDISAYSLVALTRAAMPLMEQNGGGSVLALSYYGAEKAVEGYNLMGVAKSSLESSVRYLAANLGPKNIRVNAISAGPVNTLAARGIRGFTTMLKHHADRAPLRRNVELAEVGNAAMFLLSPLASGITGEVMYVDCGYNVVAS
jgi:enoyl-[acyl-carrier protein] reductase I